MELSIYIVDAFTQQQFKGNSAAVIPLDDWIDAELMQQIAAENNLSETAFIKKRTNNQYEIRWFSPLTEIDFCGHATLASSFVLFNCLNLIGDIEFVTLAVGTLTVKQLTDGRIEMSFPNQCPDVVNEIPAALIDGLSIIPVTVLKNRQAYVVVLATAQDVLNIEYDEQQLKTLAPHDLVVTASGNVHCDVNSNSNSNCNGHADFVSRYFWPSNGGREDPVTGSIHSALAPYWSTILNKKTLVAIQASERGGKLFCKIEGDRVLVSGFGVLYLEGKIHI